MTHRAKEQHISEPRINDRIRVPEVRLVGPNGEQVGIVAIRKALDLAREADLEPGQKWTGWHVAEKDLWPPKTGYTKLTDAQRKQIADQLVANGAVLQIGRSAYDPGDAMGKMMFNIMATFAEFEADVASQRTKEGLAIARAKGRLNGKPPKLSKRQHLKVLEEFESGDVTVGDLAEDYGVDRATVYRTIKRAKAQGEGSR